MERCQVTKAPIFNENQRNKLKSLGFQFLCGFDSAIGTNRDYVQKTLSGKYSYFHHETGKKETFKTFQDFYRFAKKSF